MLTQILEWWLRQMTAMAPAQFRRTARAPDALIVAVDRFEDGEPPAGTIFIRRGGTETFAAPLYQGGGAGAAAGRLATVLRLPAAAVLHREISLPLAAERDLQNVLGFEMDRLTPFQPEDIFWGVSGLRRDSARGLRMTLLITLRAPVERLLEALGRLNLKPAFLETEDGRITLGDAGARPGRRPRMAVYALCGVLALACMLVPLLHQQAALDDVQARIAQLRPAAQEALRLRGQLSIAASGNSAIAALAQGGDTLRIIAALTNALPDGTYLSDLTLKSGDLTIDGQSSNAARLIAQLAAAPDFRDPRFVAPVTRAMSGQADLFSIRATVSP